MGKAKRTSHDFFVKAGIPAPGPNVHATDYYKGYDKPLCTTKKGLFIINSEVYFWINDDVLKICPEYPADPDHPILIAIPKESILSFMLIGDIQTYQKTTGGGVSIGGAVVGAALMGGPGAILGGRKKTETQTVTDDKRKTVLVFREDGKQKTMFFGPELYEFLCQFCIEKKDAPLNQPEPVADDIPTQIKKLADLHEQGILTDEEFSSKKAELLARI